MLKTAMLLAAGRGERLKPFTLTHPKALYPIDGTPLIEHHVIRLASIGYTRIVINHAYLGGQIRAHLGHGARFDVEIIYTPEPPGGLETGGGLYNALPWLQAEPFLTINADILTDYPFETIKAPSPHQAHVVLVPTPAYKKQSDFGLDGASYATNEAPSLTFSGIASCHPSCFNACQPGRYSVTPLLRQWATQKKLSGEIYHGLWRDVGVMSSNDGNTNF